MVTVNGKDYITISDVKKDFGVSVKAIRDYINKGIIPRPPQVAHGTKLIDYFPPEYVEVAKNSLKEYREQKQKVKLKRKE